MTIFEARRIFEDIEPEHICSICNNNLLDHNNCYHWPGREYLVDGEMVLCVIHKRRMPYESYRGT